MVKKEIDSANIPRILLVEDNAIVQYVLQTRLSKLLCKIDMAEDGLKAIGLLKNPYDLILVDIEMPNLDGFEFAKFLRRYEEINQLKRTPLVISTANKSVTLEQVKAAGADDQYSKPIFEAQLLEMFQKWLPQYFLEGKGITVAA